VPRLCKKVSKSYEELESRVQVLKTMKDSHSRHRSNIETKQCASNDGHRGDDIDISDHVAHDEGEGEGQYPKYIGKGDE
jgi:hypothetical protein